MSKACIIAGIFLACFKFSGLRAQTQTYSWDNLPKIETPVFKSDTILITAYGAKSDGVTLNTASINKAIATCSAQGGGVVVIPAGIWITGPIVMQSNVNLHLNRSALLQFTDDKNQYQLVEGDFEGHRAIRNQSPITGTNLENIAITGEGIIDGHGEVWRPIGKDKITENQWKQLIASGGLLSSDGRTWYPSESYARGQKTPNAGIPAAGKSLKDYEDIKDFFRPNLLVFNGCRKVLLQGVTFQNSPAWCLHTLDCEQLTFDGVRVRNEDYAQNGDGMDIESCSYVRVENCTLDCGDDGICIKSGKDEEGRKRGKASQYMVIRNNVVYKAHGGFVIGSEMSGGAHDIFVSDCTFIGTASGLRFKTARGRGGIVENIFIRNTRMRNIIGDAITFDMYYFAKAPTLAQTNGKVDIPPTNDGTPQFRKFYIDHLVCDGADRGILLRGLPEMSIRDIQITDAHFRTNKGAEIIEGANITLTNVQFTCKQNKPLINIENSRQLTFNNLTSARYPDLFFSVNGDRSGKINIAHTVLTKSQLAFQYGADDKGINIIN